MRRWSELIEQIRKNRRDKKFWTLLFASIKKLEEEKTDRNRKSYRKRLDRQASKKT